MKRLFELLLLVTILSYYCGVSGDPRKYGRNIYGEKRPCYNKYNCPKDCRCDGSRVYCGDGVETNVEAWPKGLLSCTEELHLSGTCKNGRSHQSSCIGKLKKEYFVTLNKLREFTMKNTLLETLPSGIFENLPYLASLTLSGNRLTLSQDINFFGDIPSLKSLDLTNNFITNIQPTLFKGLSNLEKLDMSYNAIAMLKTGMFRSLPKLQNLKMSNNILKDVPRNAFKELTSLKKLSLASNNIRHVTYMSFNGPNLLESIRLSNNKLESLPENAFSEVRKVDEVHLDNNNFAVCSCETYRAVQKMLLKNIFVEGICGDENAFLATVTEKESCSDIKNVNKSKRSTGEDMRNKIN